MNARNLKRKSETDWARVDRMTDAEIDTSDIPPLDDAFFDRAMKVLPRIKVDRINLMKAGKFADHILRKNWSNKKTNLVHDAFNIALIVSYARPFSDRRDLDERREVRLDRQVETNGLLNEEERKLHERIKELRHELFANSDASSVLIKGFDYSKNLSFMKRELNLTKNEVELLKKIIDKWITYLEKQISLTKISGILIAPDAES
ncbi:MAG TPA: hypothetical protein VNO50_13430 [Pyrinomonadaceae bacterium]|nr:hypothetical protein [Pyrinomonadaceae bacterium]